MQSANVGHLRTTSRNMNDANKTIKFIGQARPDIMSTVEINEYKGVIPYQINKIRDKLLQHHLRFT